MRFLRVTYVSRPREKWFFCPKTLEGFRLSYRGHSRWIPGTGAKPICATPCPLSPPPSSRTRSIPRWLLLSVPALGESGGHRAVGKGEGLGEDQGWIWGSRGSQSQGGGAGAGAWPPEPRQLGVLCSLLVADSCKPDALCG